MSAQCTAFDCGPRRANGNPRRITDQGPLALHGHAVPILTDAQKRLREVLIAGYSAGQLCVTDHPFSSEISNLKSGSVRVPTSGAGRLPIRQTSRLRGTVDTHRPPADNPRMIREADTDTLILRCFPVMHELRPHITTPQDLLPRIRRQMEHGYHMVFLEENDRVMSVAGYRIAEMLAWGKHMYVDDLVTTAAAQGTGCGSRLFDWLVAKAREAGCEQFHLDSGVHRFAAHRFYLHKSMDITSHHFAMKL